MAQWTPNYNPLDGHQVTDDYRTKMVDWMIEVCTSFQCSDRTWFLAVIIFDQYLDKLKGIKVIKNPDVHSIGICCMYIAAKYEDVYPFSSYIAYERISHKAVSQKDILKMEGDFYRLFEFSLEYVSPFDFH
jgi:cyclin-A